MYKIIFGDVGLPLSGVKKFTEDIDINQTTLYDSVLLDYTRSVPNKVVRCKLTSKFPNVYLYRKSTNISAERTVYVDKSVFGYFSIKKALRDNYYQIKTHDSVDVNYFVTNKRSNYPIVSMKWPETFNYYLYSSPYENTFRYCNFNSLYSWGSFSEVIVPVFLFASITYYIFSRFINGNPNISIISSSGHFYTRPFPGVQNQLSKHVRNNKEKYLSFTRCNEDNMFERYVFIRKHNKSYYIVKYVEKSYSKKVYHGFKIQSGRLYVDEEISSSEVTCSIEEDKNGKQFLKANFSIFGDLCSLVITPHENMPLPLGFHSINVTVVEQLYIYKLYRLILEDTKGIDDISILNDMCSIFDCEAIGLYYIDDLNHIDVIKYESRNDDLESVLFSFVKDNSSIGKKVPFEYLSWHVDKYVLIGNIINLYEYKHVAIMVIDNDKFILRYFESMFLEFLNLIILHKFCIKYYSERQHLGNLDHAASETGSFGVYEVIEPHHKVKFGSINGISPASLYESVKNSFHESLENNLLVENFIPYGNSKLWALTRVKKYFSNVFSTHLYTYLFRDLSIVLNQEPDLGNHSINEISLSLTIGLNMVGYNESISKYHLSTYLGYHELVEFADCVHEDDRWLLTTKGLPNYYILRVRKNESGFTNFVFLSANENRPGAGFIHELPEYEELKVSIVPEINFAVHPEAGRDFAFFAIDPSTNQVIALVSNKYIQSQFVKAECPAINNILSFVSQKDVSLALSAYTRVYQAKYRDAEATVMFDFGDGNYVYSTFYFSRVQSSAIFLYVININEHNTIMETNKELTNLVNTAFRYSNVVTWCFEAENESSKIITRQLNPRKPYIMNWSTLRHNIAAEDQPLFKRQLENALYNNKIINTEIVAIFEKERHYVVRGLKTKQNHIAGVMIDNTELRDLTEQAEVETKKVEDATKAKSMYFTNMSHEIKTPLNSMSGLLGLLEKSDIVNQNKEMLKVIRTCYNKLLDILNDTLDLEKIEQKKMTSSNVNFNIYDSFLKVIETFEQRAADAFVELKGEITPGTPPMFNGDSYAFERILTNLLVSSIRCSSKGRVSCLITSNNQSNLKICIEDTGVPFSEEEKDKLFLPFYHPSYGNEIRRNVSTTLATVQKMADMVGATISTSCTPRSTIFEVTFKYESSMSLFIPRKLKTMNLELLFLCSPSLINKSHMESLCSFLGFRLIFDEFQATDKLSVIVSESSHIQISKVDKLKEKYPDVKNILICRYDTTVADNDCIIATLSSFSARFMKYFLNEHVPKYIRRGPFKKMHLELKKLRVLVADDDAVGQMFIEKILKAIDVHYKIVPNGEEVISSLSESTYDVLFLDCYMPKMDGPTTARAIRQTNKKIIIYAITAATEKEILDDFMSSGANKCIEKPYSIQKIRSALEDVLLHL